MMALLSACASGPGGGPGGPEGGPPPQRSEIFVSPYGELFVSQAGEPYPVAAWFADADADSDGRLTAEEFAADGRRWFATLDQDGDGLVGPGEIFAYERLVDATFTAMGGGMGGGPGGGPGGGMSGGRGSGRGGPPGGGQMNLNGDQQDGGMGGPMGGGMGGMGGQEGGGSGAKPRAQPYRGGTERLARAGLLSVPQPVRAADRNADQKITPEEWTAAGERWFALLDQDHDGVLTLETLPKTAVQGGAGGRGGLGGRPPRR
jgi:Ca2+-binding EF-hand superfamily protein